MVKIFVNGQEVSKEELSKIEIQSERVKQILLKRLTKSNKRVYNSQ